VKLSWEKMRLAGRDSPPEAALGLGPFLPESQGGNFGISGLLGVLPLFLVSEV